MIYRLCNAVHDVKVHTVECHAYFRCVCTLEDRLYLEKGEVIVLFDTCDYADIADRPEEFEGVKSFIVLLRGRFCSICLDTEDFRLEEITCSNPITLPSSVPSPEPSVPGEESSSSLPSGASFIP